MCNSHALKHLGLFRRHRPLTVHRCGLLLHVVTFVCVLNTPVSCAKAAEEIADAVCLTESITLAQETMYCMDGCQISRLKVANGTGLPQSRIDKHR